MTVLHGVEFDLMVVGTAVRWDRNCQVYCGLAVVVWLGCLLAGV